MSEASTATSVLAGIDGIMASLEDLYRDVHAHPELSMQEHRTAERAAEHLQAVGYDVTTGVGGTGVVGLLRNGDGPTVMLRADMDALPVKEATGLPYASTATATDPADAIATEAQAYALLQQLTDDIYALEDIENDGPHLKDAIRLAQRRTHPDTGGDTTEFRKVMKAVELVGT